MKQRTFQFGANLADQNVAAKNAKVISDGKFYSEVCHEGSVPFLVTKCQHAHRWNSDISGFGSI